MGLAVYVEDQIHGRSYAEEAGRWLTRVVVEAVPGSVLSGTYPHGDTMFNVPQLNRISAEFEEILARRPDLKSDVDALLELFEQVRRMRGYLWVSGD
ncbi:MAG: hypothetical protein QOI21_2520 [Actinomycetota bacterium]|jgi:hypothetical protein|nr:hypothetical protein [Actinomycetota bacterium]